MKDIELVIWDLDGTIVDSEPVHHRIQRELLLEYSNGETGELGFDGTGYNTAQYYDDFIKRFHGTTTGEAAARRHYALVLDGVLESISEPNPGVRDCMAAFQTAGILQAVASSSPRSYVAGVIAHLGLTDFFSCIVCGDEVTEQKPDPEPYQRVLDALHIPSERAIAVEDSHSGMLSALAAGLRCVGYAPLPGQDLSRATVCIRDMQELMTFVMGA